MVRADTGEAVAAARLTLIDSAGAMTTAVSDVGGAFSFENVAEGTCSLEVVAEGFVTSVSTVSVPVASHTVQLARVDATAPLAVASITVRGELSVPVGGSTQLTAVALYTDGSRRDVSLAAKWSASSPFLVSISSSGLVTGYTAGTTVVSAGYGSVTGSSTITVTPR